MDFYDDDGTVQEYQAHRHGGQSSPNQVMEEPALRRELGDVRGLRVADLGCGDAAIAGELMAAGAASYAGIDRSASMLRAAEAELPAGATVTQCAIEDFAPGAGTFDLIISRLALHYVEDLGSVLAACALGLGPGGRLVVTVAHPVLTAIKHPAESDEPRTSWLVDDYFDSGPRDRRWFSGWVRWQHRTIEEHVAAMLGAGFAITAVRECAPEPGLFAGNDAELARRRRTPMFLLLAGRIGDTIGTISST